MKQVYSVSISYYQVIPSDKTKGIRIYRLDNEVMPTLTPEPLNRITEFLQADARRAATLKPALALDLYRERVLLNQKLLDSRRKYGTIQHLFSALCG